LVTHTGNGAVDISEQHEPVGLPPGQNCLGLNPEEERRSASALVAAMPSLVDALKDGKQAILANTGRVIVATDQTKKLIEKMQEVIDAQAKFERFLLEKYPGLLTKAIKDAFE
jgi:hypothetical protein